MWNTCAHASLHGAAYVCHSRNLLLITQLILNLQQVLNSLTHFHSAQLVRVKAELPTTQLLPLFCVPRLPTRPPALNIQLNMCWMTSISHFLLMDVENGSHNNVFH